MDELTRDQRRIVASDPDPAYGGKTYEADVSELEAKIGRLHALADRVVARARARDYAGAEALLREGEAGLRELRQVVKDRAST